MNKRINEINKILEERRAELANCTPERMQEIDKETEALINERKALVEAESQRARILERFGKGTDVEVSAEERASGNRTEDTIKGMSKRQQAAYVLGKQARKHPFTAEERAALSAITTTDPKFVQAEDGSTLGINNGGLLIKTSVLFDLLKEEHLLSGIVADMNFTEIKGLVSYPYKKRKIAATPKKEGASTGVDGQYEWALLETKKGMLQAKIKVSAELEALTDFDLGDYILGELLADFNESVASQLIYSKGTVVGTAQTVLGLVGSKSATSATDYTQACIAAIKALPKEYRTGAKIYVAQDVYDSIFFDTDALGNFKHPVFNGASLSSIGAAQVVVDGVLKDGDIVCGNVGRYFKANTLIPTKIEKQPDIDTQVTLYSATQFVASAPIPEAFTYYHVTPAAK